MAAELSAQQLPIAKIFSPDYIFSIPPYQRPYAWTKEQASEMFDDLITSLGTSDCKIDAISPYFLGSIVLVKGEGPESDILDGQQRLTTLTILLSALRENLPTDHSALVTPLIYDKANAIMGSPDRFRLTLKTQDQNFFERHIQRESSIDKIEGVKPTKLNDAQKNLRENAILLLSKVKALDEGIRIRLTQYVVKRCHLVVVSTSDSDSAFRIFSVMNARGLDLTTSDILKAEIIGSIPVYEQERYTGLWDSVEEKLGREAFGALFAHIRMIHRKTKPKDTLLKDFHVYVKPSSDPKGFLENTLVPYSDAYETILGQNYAGDEEEKINDALTWLAEIDYVDWQPPAILYLTKHKSDSKRILGFLKDLDRLTAILMINRADVNERIDRFSKLISAIEADSDISLDGSPLQLSSNEQREAVSVLMGDIYEQKKTRLFILKRLDSLLAGPGAKYDHKNITIEHVLPQTPGLNSQWITWWPDESLRKSYVHRLGNLVLLDRAKNASANNYDFEKKKKSYFSKKGVSPFQITTTVLIEKEWTPDVVRRRQHELVGKLCDIFRLSSDTPESLDLGSSIFSFHGSMEFWDGPRSQFIELFNDGEIVGVDSWTGKQVFVAIDGSIMSSRTLAELRAVPFFKNVTEVIQLPSIINVDRVAYCFDYDESAWIDDSGSYFIYLLNGITAASYPEWDGKNILIQTHDNKQTIQSILKVERLKNVNCIEFPMEIEILGTTFMYDMEEYIWASEDDKVLYLCKGKRKMQQWLPDWDKVVVDDMNEKELMECLVKYPFFNLKPMSD